MSRSNRTDRRFAHAEIERSIKRLVRAGLVEEVWVDGVRYIRCLRPLTPEEKRLALLVSFKPPEGEAS
jgi:hypothetical protein